MARGRRLELAFSDAAAALEPRERRFARELAYGTVRLRGRLDHLLSLRVHGGLDRLEAAVLDLLRLGAYQLLEMDGVPRYAAVSETVDQVREAGGRGAAGLANAVLRRVADAGDGPEHFPDPGQAPAAFLSTWGSHPRWLVERWLSRWSFDDVRALVEANNTPPPIVLLPLDHGRDEALGMLADAGVEAEPAGAGSDGLVLAPGTDPTEALAVLPSIVQDPASTLVARFADVPEGATVLDLCAAPGGKALALSRRAARVIAADLSRTRLGLVRDNARRTATRIPLVQADARHPPFGEADVVLVDAPCTGTGTLRRHPDGRWRLEPATLELLTELQRDVLSAAARHVSSGGLLVYSTCSLERDENQDRVEAFLDEHPRFVREPGDAVPARYLDGGGHLEVLPWTTGFDGAFAARLRRR